MSDRAYGRLKERFEIEAGTLRHMSDTDLEQRAQELQQKLGLAPEERIVQLERELEEARALLPAADDSKVN